MKAKALNAITILQTVTLPNGVKVLISDCADHQEFKALPAAVEFQGTKYGRSAWNSDLGIAYYRSDRLTAACL